MSAAARQVRPITRGDHTVVIGGGPAGLTAAYLLAKDGHAVTVLEADRKVGGISRTEDYKGYRFDIGGHRFFTKIEPVQRLWEEILGEDFLCVPRLSRIHYRGHFFDYPLRARNALTGLGLWRSFGIVLSYLKAQFRPSPIEENFEQWVSNRFGKKLYEIFFRTYTEKVWGIPCTEIRSEWAAQRIQNLSLGRAILDATSINRRSKKIKSLIDEFHYPRLGPGQMWEACRDRIRKLGGEVLMNHEAHELVLRAGRVVAVKARHDGKEVAIECDHVISSMALRDLVRTCGDQAPEQARTAAEGLRYRDFLVVTLMVDEPHLFPDNWIYVHTPGVKVGRIQNFNNWSRAMVPDKDRTCLGMEYFCFEGDGLWNSDDADLIRLASEEIDRLNLAPADKIRDGCVIRQQRAYPIYDSAYQGHIDGIREFIDPIDNLHTVGRNGMHKYNNQDHSMLTAMMAVQNMNGGSYDIWSVNTDFEYHEEQRVDETTPSSESTSRAR